MKPRVFFEEDKGRRCIYNFRTPEKLVDLIHKYEAGTFTKWKRFRGVGFDKKYQRSSNSIYDVNEYSAPKLTTYGNELLEKIKSTGKINQRFKRYYFPGIGVCIKLKTARMIC